MTSHRVTPTDRTPDENAEQATSTPARDPGRTLPWAQPLLCAAGITAAVVVWALGGPPTLAVALATATATGAAGWQITVNVRR
ncbi:hypothetical protein [Streptomyces aureus]|uniref:hypothetical protein n=1 Tax=Streptomyces aureus TaxID=193461 RepID=UPI0033F62F8C